MNQVTAPLEPIADERPHRCFLRHTIRHATKKLYERIGERIRRNYNNNKKVITTIGAKQVQPSPRYSDIATFKAQNREMNEQFFSEIRRADVVVADFISRANGTSSDADKLGNIRTQTLRAFTSAEMEKILANIP